MRWRLRHTHKTVADFLEVQLATLGWVNAPVNFGTTPITFLEFQPELQAPKVVIAPNTVAITIGDEPAAEDMEIGDGIKSIKYPLFVDIYGEKRPIALSIGSDVKDLLSDRYLYVVDFTAAVPVTSTEQIEIEKESVFMETPEAVASAEDIRKNWIVVKAMVTVFYV